jgi:hypothetical protein
MKKILKHFPLISLAVLPTSSLFVCPSQNENENYYTHREAANASQKNAIPETNYKKGDIYVHDKALISLGQTADLDVQMKELIYKSR